MNIFRIFFVSTVLIPVLVVVATSDDSGVIIRRPTRSIVISEDGTRSARRHQPVNISDRNCPALGCTGNLTSDTFNGKGSVAATILPASTTETFGNERFDTSEILLHHHPLKIEIKSIKNSTTPDSLESRHLYIDDEGTGRSVFPTSVLLSWVVYWGWKAFLSFVVFRVVRFVFSLFKLKLKVADNYIEYYVKLGQDSKHPFSSYGGGWLPTFGVSLKSKADKGWKPPKGWKAPDPPKYVHSYYSVGYGGHHHRHHSSPSYHSGPPAHGGWGWPKQKGWKSKKHSSSEEENIKLRHKFDQTKGQKYAKKYAKKYGKKAHKYGLQPSRWSHIYDQYGNVLKGYDGTMDVPTGLAGWGRADLAVKNSTKLEKGDSR